MRRVTGRSAIAPSPDRAKQERASEIHKLTATAVDKLLKGRKLGKHWDGGGLCLQIDEGADGNIRSSWVFRFQPKGRESQIGLVLRPPVRRPTIGEVLAASRK